MHAHHGGGDESDLTQVSGSWSKCKGAPAAMVSKTFRLKFSREMGIHPGRSVPMFGLGTPIPWVRGPKNGPGLDVAAGLNTTEGLEFAAGVLNAPGQGGYPW